MQGFLACGVLPIMEILKEVLLTRLDFADFLS